MVSIYLLARKLPQMNIVCTVPVELYRDDLETVNTFSVIKNVSMHIYSFFLCNVYVIDV